VTILLAIKYAIQYFIIIRNRKNIKKESAKPYSHSSVVFLIAISIYVLFVFSAKTSSHVTLGIITLIIGLVIGISGIVKLNKNYHNDLVAYNNSILVTDGIFAIIRNPIRLGIILETISLALFINRAYILPLLCFYLFVNYRRTIVEEQFLIKVFPIEADYYFKKVPRFNVFKGFFLHLSKIKFGFHIENITN